VKQLIKKILACSRVLAMCLLVVVCSVGMVTAEESAEPVDWDVLPNGLIEVQYDRNGDGVPDHVTLHQITWSGWTSLPVADLTAQARNDGEWVFIVEYDQDRYVYLAQAEPLFLGDDAQQDGRWVAVPSSCPLCAR